MKIDGIATSEHLDSSGEVLDIKGLDVTDFEEGKGVLNFEHNNDSPEDIIGKITYCKKIYKKDDCEDDRQKMYWEHCKKPFLYIIGELFDSEKHPGAIALAALIRYYHNRGEKVLAGFSVEGQTLDREGQQLKRTVGRRVATTLRPCNKTCISGVLEDSASKEFLDKTMKEGQVIEGLVEVDSVIFDDVAHNTTTEQDVKAAITDLNKTLTAGGYDAAPGTLTGGSALQVEHNASKKKQLTRAERNQLKSLVRDKPKTMKLKEWVKAQMPEVSDNYIDHFTDVAESFSLAKNDVMGSLVRIDNRHHMHPMPEEEQSQLVEGLDWNPSAQMDAFDNEFSGHIYNMQNDAGSNVVVKTPSKTLSGNESARNASLYYNIAKSVFGLHDHVPATTHFVHPLGYDSEDGSSHWHVSDYKENTMSPLHSADAHIGLQKSRDNGMLHKLALMDIVTGTDDRGHHNVLVGKDGLVHHIDNETAFEYHPTLFTGYMEEINNGPGLKHDSVHQDTREWLSRISPIKLQQEMKKHGIHSNAIKKSIVALSALKSMSQRGASIGTMRHHIQSLWNDVDTGRN